MPDALAILKKTLDQEFPEAVIDTVGSVQEARDLIDKAVARLPYDAVILDYKLPKRRGEAADLDEELWPVIRREMPECIVAHISAYANKDQERGAATADSTSSDPFRNFHTERGQKGFVVSKLDTRWGDELLKKLKQHLYGDWIAKRMDLMLGEGYGESRAGLQRGKSIGRSRARGALGLTHELGALCGSISRHWSYLDKALQTRIQKHFDVNTRRTPIRVSLK